MRDANAGHVVTAPPQWPLPELLGPAIPVARGRVLANDGAELSDLLLIDEGVVGRFVGGGAGEGVGVGAGGRRGCSGGVGGVLRGVHPTGFVIGAGAALTGGRLDATVCALTDCRVRPLPREAFAAAARVPAASAWLSSMLAADARDQSRWLVATEAGAMALTEVLLGALFAAAARAQPDGTLRLTFPLSVTQMAAFVGVTRQYMSQMLAALSDAGAVAHRDDRFWLPPGSRLHPRVLAGRRIG